MCDRITVPTTTATIRTHQTGAARAPLGRLSSTLSFSIAEEGEEPDVPAAKNLGYTSRAYTIADDNSNYYGQSTSLSFAD